MKYLGICQNGISKLIAYLTNMHWGGQGTGIHSLVKLVPITIHGYVYKSYVTLFP